MADPQKRRWQLTINNPLEKGFDSENVVKLLGELTSLEYYCFSYETGAEGTHHIHIYIVATSGIRFSTLKNKFPSAHLEVCKGNSASNRDYIFKEGKHLDSEKGTTNHRDTHVEWGVLPEEHQGKRTDLTELYDMISSGMTNAQILADNPDYMKHIDKMDKVRQEVLFDKFRDVIRCVNVTYVYGLTGTGKTRHITEKYGLRNVYRVTDYKHPFDNYKGQDVIIFEEFRSSLNLADMLNYLDVYPIELPCRYNNKCACFTKIYLCSNIGLYEQYPNIQKEEKESYNAFLRRIHNVKVYTGKEIKRYKIADYKKENELIDCPIEKTPFKCV